MRARMTMRADIERNTAEAVDGWNNPVAPVFTPHLSALPCYVWGRQNRAVVDGSKTAMIEDLRGLFPLGADLRQGDEIARVTDRRGETLIAGRLRIETPPQRRRSHLEAALQRIQ